MSRTQVVVLIAVVAAIVILTSIQNSLAIFFIAILLASAGIYLFIKSPPPEVSLFLQDELYELEPDRERRERLLEIARVQYPGQSESWYWKKVIEDLRSVEDIKEDIKSGDRSWRWRRLVEDLMRNRR